MHPIITLAACESGYSSSPSSELDEYCGLDLAFKIAGASTIFSSMWPIADDFAALASTTFPQWLLQGTVSPAHAIVIFQTNLRNGDWTTWLLRKEQLAQIKELHPEIYDSVQDIQSKFRSFPKDYFRDQFY